MRLSQVHLLAWSSFSSPLLRDDDSSPEETANHGMIVELYDNPRYWGNRKLSSTRTCHFPVPRPPPLAGEQQPDLYAAWNTNLLISFQSPGLSANFMSALSLPGAGDDGVQARAAFERVVTRLALILALVPEPAASSCPRGAGAGGGAPIARDDDVERVVLSFPILCFSPFLPLILSSDSRALIVLLHFYRAANAVLPQCGPDLCLIPRMDGAPMVDVASATAASPRICSMRLESGVTCATWTLLCSLAGNDKRAAF